MTNGYKLLYKVILRKRKEPQNSAYSGVRFEGTTDKEAIQKLIQAVRNIE